tara:strand:+ start:243 stop:713 length:471 start_codon:yes stop_codon:yes gene_type:complete
MTDATHFTYKSFSTTDFYVMIEDMTTANSAFGVTDDGETVFFGQRIVDKIKINSGDFVEAQCVPNYADKRDHIPWRCVRATKIKVESPADAVDHIQLTDFNVIADAMRSDKGWWTQVELEEHLSDEGISAARIDDFLTDENQPLEQAVAFRILPGD